MSEPTNPFSEIIKIVREMVDQAIVDLKMTDCPANRVACTQSLFNVMKTQFNTQPDGPTFGQSMTLIALKNLEMEYMNEKVRLNSMN